SLVLPGETLAFGRPGDVHQFAGRKEISLQRLADFIAGVGLETDLAHVAMGGDPGLLEVAGVRLVELLLLRLKKAQLDRAIAIFLNRAQRDNDTGSGLEHGDRQELTLLGEHLGHPDLLGQQPFRRHGYSLISMLTPDARLSRISAS